MKEEMIDRLNELISKEGLSINKFAASIGMAQVTVNNYFIGKRKLSLEVITSVLNAYPNLSAEWLLRGKGEMILKEEQPSLSQQIEDAINSHDLRRNIIEEIVRDEVRNILAEKKA